MTAEYVLTADYFLRRDDKGVLRELHRGAILADLSDDDVRRLEGCGAVVERGAYEAAQAEAEAIAAAEADAAAAVVDLADGDDDAGTVVAPVSPTEAPAFNSAAAGDRPKTAATTDAWREYAERGGIPADKAAAMSKRELIAATR